MKTLTRGYCIQEDIVDPTPWENEASAGENICECFLCEKEIDTDYDRVYTVDGLEDVPICEHCFCFRKFTANDLFDRLSIDFSRNSARINRKRRGA